MDIGIGDYFTVELERKNKYAKIVRSINGCIEIGYIPKSIFEFIKDNPTIASFYHVALLKEIPFGEKYD